MNRRLFIKRLGTCSAGMAFGTVPYNLFAKEDYLYITILHTNDLHAHVESFSHGDDRDINRGGLARISGLVKKVRSENENTLLFDAGDMFQGTPYFNYYKGELMFKLMHKVGYNAGIIGNHEFDNGLDGLYKPLNNAKFPIINSNYDFSDTILNGKIPKYKIYKRSGVKIGVYGLGVKLEGLVNKKQYGNTKYIDPLMVARDMEMFLKNEQKCDLVVCLSHLGLRYRNNRVSDVIIAEQTENTDLIIGGHTHTYLKKPLIMKNKKNKQVIVNQAWWGGLMVGEINYVFERTNKRKESVFINNIGI